MMLFPYENKTLSLNNTITLIKNQVQKKDLFI